MSELAIYAAPPEERWRYCQALADASLLPRAYQKAPANLLLALEYGSAVGVAPAIAIQGIHVIEGKPTASANLIGALVRKAGHRLRVTGDERSAVATIVRADDPDFEFRSEWTIDRARNAGLVGKDVWKKYPANMLKARAITEVARDACPDVLAGIQYTPEELNHDEVDAPGPVTVERVDEGALTKPVERSSAVPADDPWYGEPVADVTDAVVVDETPAGVGGGEAPTPAGRNQREHDESGPFLSNPDGPPTQAQTRMMFGLLKGDDGKARPREESLAIIAGIVEREIESSADLTKAEVSRVIDALQRAGAA